MNHRRSVCAAGRNWPDCVGGTVGGGFIPVVRCSGDVCSPFPAGKTRVGRGRGKDHLKNAVCGLGRALLRMLSEEHRARRVGGSIIGVRISFGHSGEEHACCDISGVCKFAEARRYSVLCLQPLQPRSISQRPWHIKADRSTALIEWRDLSYLLNDNSKGLPETGSNSHDGTLVKAAFPTSLWSFTKVTSKERYHCQQHT